MFCSKCGNEVMYGQSYCSKCGCEITQDIPNGNQQPHRRNSESTKKIWITIFGVAALVTVVILLIGALNRGMDLKYGWGTTPEELEENEVILWDGTDFTGKDWRVCCEDPYNEVDGIDEFEIEDEEVIYEFDRAEGLYRIYYYLVDGNTVRETVDTIQKYYGSNYYYDESLHTYFWWIDNNVLEYSITYNSIDYYDESYFLDREHIRELYDEMIEYFGKQ